MYICVFFLIYFLFSFHFNLSVYFIYLLIFFAVIICYLKCYCHGSYYFLVGFVCLGLSIWICLSNTDFLEQMKQLNEHIKQQQRSESKQTDQINWELLTKFANL